MKLLYPAKRLKLGINAEKASKNAALLHKYYFKHRKQYLIPDYSKAETRKLKWKWYREEVLQASYDLAKKNGKVVQKMTGVSMQRQFIDMVKLSLTLPCRPQSYYIFDFFDPKNRAVARDYIYRHEVKNVLYKMLLKGTKKIQEKSPLTNKGDFADKAKKAGLPLAPTFCSIKNEKVKLYEEIPKEDLFVKALNGKGGRGAEAWFYLQDEDRYQKMGETKSYEISEVLEAYRVQSKKSPVIIQGKLRNHPDVADISCDAVSTCRVVTLINEDDQPEVVAAVFRMAARSGHVVDNIHAGGVSSPIAIDTGVLGQAINLGINAGLGRVSTHPVTGAAIEGRQLPYWDEILSLAVHAHDCFRPRVLVGWDICITDAGPVVIEGNAQPCVDIIQRAENRPIGTTRMGELLAYHIQKNFKKKKAK